MNREQLEELAAVMVSAGTDAYYWASIEGGFPRLCFMNKYQDWDGKEENPALAFAFLDLLEKAGYATFNWRKCFDGYILNAFKIENQPWRNQIQGGGDTKTEALANTVLFARSAGLLAGTSEGVETHV